MELLLEVVMYLLVVLGIITVCCTFFSKVNLIDTLVTRDNIIENASNTYRRLKKENQKVIVTVKYKDIDKEEIENIKEAISKGKYENILDVADKVKYINLNKVNKK